MSLRSQFALLHSAAHRVRTRPDLLYGGAIVVGLEGGAVVAALAVARSSGPVTGLLVGLGGFLAVDTLVAPALVPGVVAGSRWGATGVPWDDASQQYAGRLLPARVVVALVTLVGGSLLALAAGGVALGAVTAVEFAARAVSEWGLDPRPTVLLVAAAATVGFLAVRVALAFTSHLVVERGVSGLRAPRASVHLALARPRAVLENALVRAAVFALPWLAAAGVSAAVSPGAIRLPDVAVYLAVGTVTRSVGLAAGIAAYEADLAAPASLTTVPRGFPAPGRRTALAGLLVVGLVAGAGAVRVADVDPGATGPAEVDPDAPPTAVVERAFDRLDGASYRASSYFYPEGIDGEGREPYVTRRVDDDRTRFTVDTVVDGSQRPVARYQGEAVIGYNRTLRRDPAPNGSVWDHGVLEVRRQNGWQVLVYVPRLRADRQYDPSAAEWHVQDRTDETITYGVDDPAAVAAVVWGLPAAANATYANTTRIRATVDRETGYLRRVAVYAEYRTTDPPNRTVDGQTVELPDERSHGTGTRYTDYDDVEVRRPAALGPPGPVELLADLIAY